MDEKRCIERYSMSVPAKIAVLDQAAENVIFQTYTKDVSSRGTFIAMDNPLEIGQKVHVELYLSINKLKEFFELDETVKVEVSGQVVRHAKDGIGISFDKRYQILPHDGGSNSCSD